MPPERSATSIEISAAVGVLFRQMRLPKGVTAEERTEGYVVALEGMPLSSIEGAITKFLRDEVPGFEKNEYCPRPPTLARIARDIGKAIAAEKKSKLYAYRAPRSKMLEQHVTKAWAMQLIDNGVHPRGSIWCPGPVSDHPEYGSLYAPDAGWKPAVPMEALGSSETDHHFVADDAAARYRVAALLADAGLVMPSRKLDDRDARYVPAEPRTIPDYSKDKLEISPALAKQFEERKRVAALLAETEGTEFDMKPKKRRGKR